MSTAQLSTDQAALAEALAAFIRDASGQAARVTRITPLAGGASRETLLLDLLLDERPQKLVMRRDLPTQMTDIALTRAQEYRLMHAAYAHGVRVARVRWLCETPGDFGLERPFFLMDYVPGESVGRKVVSAPELAAARAVLPEQMAEQLALIHRLDPTSLDFLRRPAGDDPAADILAETYATLDGLDAQVPAFEFALRWAEAHRPSTERLTFVHGDFRVGNLLVDADGLAAVIDWEFAHIGDPCEELGYLCMRDWRFGVDGLRAGGLCDRERLLLAYEAASRTTVARAAVDWWEIVGNIRWGVICLSQAERHLSGRDPSVELASLGRRSAEMQYEALRLIEASGL